ncbi:MAG: Rpn family recombination-promoting nuclease/putative transposase [Trichormus sp. ATA11-4-KO1]|jgi:predicted transposase YdaD|nr:Rpn family recombination-promoting nuclease/putative transposase [Trichormus sp. ATA11-4-KO1]
MAKSSDISSKKIISLAPDKWVKWVTNIPDTIVKEILNSEFQWISRENDVLIRAESREYGKFLVLNEVQIRYKSDMPLRINAYTALAREKYKLPIYPVLINILPDGNVNIPNRYESNFAGLQARQDYRVINLWEVDVNIAFQQEISSLLPFVPILKGGDDESTIREALRLLRADEQLNQLETVLAFFATFVLESELVQQIMRWDMAILRESPWYQEIEQRGRKEGLLSGIELALEIKFGLDGLELMPTISQISDLQKLQVVKQAIKSSNTVEELQSFL